MINQIKFVFRNNLPLCYKLTSKHDQKQTLKDIMVFRLNLKTWCILGLTDSLISFSFCILIHWASKETYITSSEYHSLKSKASTWIIFGHRLGKFILNKHMYLKKQKFTSIKEEITAMKSQEVNFQKSQKLLASRAGSSKQTKAGTAFT